MRWQLQVAYKMRQGSVQIKEEDVKYWKEVSREKKSDKEIVIENKNIRYKMDERVLLYDPCEEMTESMRQNNICLLIANPITKAQLLTPRSKKLQLQEYFDIFQPPNRWLP